LDYKSTSGLRRHAKNCWGEENVSRADDAKNIDDARQALKDSKLINGRITAVFERTGKGKVTYSTSQHTRAETRYVHIFSPSSFKDIVFTGPKLLNGFPGACGHSVLLKTRAFMF
jgi:hypothetical protein